MTEEGMRAQERIAKSRERRRKQLQQRLVLCTAAVLVLLAVIAVSVTFIARRGAKPVNAGGVPAEEDKYIAERPELDVQLLPVNPYSRPGELRTTVNGIVVHYTANPGTSAKQNRDYFAGLAQTHETSASSHFIIGLEGEIVQCIPCDEIAYANSVRNQDTVSIECCIEDESGRFNEETYESLVELTTWLMGRYGLDVDAVIRHYDVTGKNCPKYYVENESSWRAFKSDLETYIEKNGIEKETQKES